MSLLVRSNFARVAGRGKELYTLLGGGGGERMRGTSDGSGAQNILWALISLRENKRGNREYS